MTAVHYGRYYGYPLRTRAPFWPSSKARSARDLARPSLFRRIICLGESSPWRTAGSCGLVGRKRKDFLSRYRTTRGGKSHESHCGHRSTPVKTGDLADQRLEGRDKVRLVYHYEGIRAQESRMNGPHAGVNAVTLEQEPGTDHVDGADDD